MYTSRGLTCPFSKMTRKAGIGHWHAHEGRHTAVSIMSSNGVPIQESGGQDVPVVRIRKVKRLDQGLIARHQTIADRPVDELA